VLSPPPLIYFPTSFNTLYFPLLFFPFSHFSFYPFFFPFNFHVHRPLDSWNLTLGLSYVHLSISPRNTWNYFAFRTFIPLDLRTYMMHLHSLHCSPDTSQYLAIPYTQTFRLVDLRTCLSAFSYYSPPLMLLHYLSLHIVRCHIYCYSYRPNYQIYC
jgi:hypothetical protein